MDHCDPGGVSTQLLQIYKLGENVIPEGCSLSGSVIQLDNIFRKLVINVSVKFGFPENVIQPDNTLVW